MEHPTITASHGEVGGASALANDPVPTTAAAATVIAKEPETTPLGPQGNFGNQKAQTREEHAEALVMGASTPLSEKGKPETGLREALRALRGMEQRLRSIAKTKPYRLAHLLRRAERDFVKGTPTGRREFVGWLSTRLRGKQTTPAMAKNPLLEMGAEAAALCARLQRSQKLPPRSPAEAAGQLAARDGAMHAHDSHPGSFLFEYGWRREQLMNSLEDELSEEVLTLRDIIGAKNFQAIVVCPHAVPWEPQQRPQHLLHELARRGYLCIFVTAPGLGANKLEIEEVESNLFVVNDTPPLLAALQPYHVLVLCTWVLQKCFADCLPHKSIWYDVLDQPESFSCFDADYAEQHESLVREASLVTYSAERLGPYVASRDDALLLPNAARLEDFLQREADELPVDLKPIKALGRPVVGYYGAIEKWFDSDLVRDVARENPDWQFLLIGRVGVDPKLLDAPNIHLLGQKNYSELAAYACHFHAAIIPFVLNDLTNCVSPVKFFEYCALGLPVISTPIQEIRQYESRTVRLAATPATFGQALRDCLTPEVRGLASRENVCVARQNRWQDRVQALETILRSKWDAAALRSNHLYGNHVAALTGTFFDANGTNFYAGGAERYLADLHKLVVKRGLDLVIYQYANHSWVRHYRGVPVVGLSASDLSSRPINESNMQQRLGQLFGRLNRKRAKLSIYSAFYENSGESPAPSIGISHGVSWDHPGTKHQDGESFWTAKEGLIESAQRCDELISVDTNTANWFQSINYQLGQRFSVIPNYVDLDIFRPRPNFEAVAPRRPLRIIYPRRLYAPRGLYLLLDILDEILIRFANVHIHFVGRGIEKDTRHVVKKCKHWGERVAWYSLMPEEMHKAYIDADIALIPSLYSEGTSLSCLEAMASGNAVIATRVGGLSDLVMDGYNGLLINPTAQALKEAIAALVSDPEQVALFKRRGREVAQAFSKKRWDARWDGILAQHLQNSPERKARTSERIVEVRIENVLQRQDVLERLVLPLLAKRDVFLYVRLKENGGLNKLRLSHGRLQFLGWNEELYTQPDRTVVDARNGKQHRAAIVFDDGFTVSKLQV